MNHHSSPFGRRPILPSSTHNLRTLFSLLNDDEFESEVAIERQRRGLDTDAQPRKRPADINNNNSNNKKKYKNSSSNNNNNNNNTVSRVALPLVSRGVHHNGAAAAVGAAAPRTLPLYPTLNVDDSDDENEDDDDEDNNINNDDEEEEEEEEDSTMPSNNNTTRKRYNWFDQYKALETFKATHHHIRVASSCKTGGAKTTLYNWISQQRRELRKLAKGQRSTLSEEKIKLLTTIGIVQGGKGEDNGVQHQHASNPRSEEIWDSHFAQLVEFKK